MEVGMADPDQGRLEKLENSIKENLIEIVALRGLVTALLVRSDLTDKQLLGYIRDEAMNPVARATPEEAISVAYPIIEETAGYRGMNERR